ncbi:MAG: PPC domain-containing protein [Trueperaceae bacterium]|nr:PPC domain-containing protein [Trueperaceae bacterium]
MRVPALRFLARPTWVTSAVFALALALAALAPHATAQARPLAAHAPADTVFALGLRPQRSPVDDLGTALADLDWEGARAGLDALTAAMGEQDLGADLPFFLRGMLGGMPGLGQLPSGDELMSALTSICPAAGDALADVSLHDADDALLSVGLSRARPVPAALLQVRPTEGARATAQALVDALASCAEGEPLQQGGHDIVVLEGGQMPVAAALAGDVLLLANDPAAVRGAIRRMEGADEPTFADGGAGAALADFGARGLRMTLDTAAVADLAEGFLPSGDQAPPMAGLMRDRGLAALRTIGGLSLRFTLTDDGITQEAVLSVDPAGGDDALAALLRCEGCRAQGPFLVPRGAVAVSGTSLPLRGWVRYVDGWLTDLAEAGAPVPPDLRTAAQAAGVDLDAALLDWIGEDMQSARWEAISPDLRRLVQQPASLTAVTVRSQEDAERGIDAMVTSVRNLAGLVEDEDFAAFAEQIVVREESYQGTTYRRVQFGPTTDVALGVVNNRLVLATPTRAMKTVIDVTGGREQDAFADEAYTELRDEAPADLTSWSYARPGADLIGLADTMDVFTQPVAFAIAAGLQAAEDEGGAAQVPSFGEGNRARTVEAPDFDASGVTPEPLSVPSSAEYELGSGALPTLELPSREVQLFRLEGIEAGDPVEIEMTSDPLDTYLYLLDPVSGRVVDSNDDAPDTSRSALTFTAPGGEVWIGTSSFFSSGGGPYTLTTRIVDDAPSVSFATGPFDPEQFSPEALSVPGDIGGQLAGNEPLVEDRGARAYRLEGFQEGDVLTVEMTSDTMDTYLYLLDPSVPTVVASNDDAGGTSRSELRFRAPAAGTEVWVAASSFNGRGEGPFQLRVTREGDEEEEEGPAVTLADVLPTLEIGPDVVRVIGEHLGVSTSWTSQDDTALRSVHRWRVDW